MVESARKLRDTYARKPGIPLFKREFGYYCLERWKEQGMPQEVPFETLFDYDPPGNLMLNHAGGVWRYGNTLVYRDSLAGGRLHHQAKPGYVVQGQLC
jgi:hypothetical protein